MKTQYRSVSNGYYGFLEYKKEYKFLFLRFYFWNRIWKPFFDRILERNYSEKYLYVCSLKDNFDSFIKTWPYIENYFEYAEIKQKELEEIAKIENRKIENRKIEDKKIIKYYRETI